MMSRTCKYSNILIPPLQNIGIHFVQRIPALVLYRGPQLGCVVYEDVAASRRKTNVEKRVVAAISCTVSLQTVISASALCGRCVFIVRPTTCLLYIRLEP